MYWRVTRGGGFKPVKTPVEFVIWQVELWPKASGRDWRSFRALRGGLRCVLVCLCVLTPSQMSSNILHPTWACKLCLMSEYTGIHLYLSGEILKKPLNSEQRCSFLQLSQTRRWQQMFCQLFLRLLDVCGTVCVLKCVLENASCWMKWEPNMKWPSSSSRSTWNLRLLNRPS